MKKTLIALAAVAAASTSFAQVSLSGEFAYGYLSTTDSTKTTSSGLGIDTAQLVFKATEDLGAGTSVAVKMSLNTNEFGTGAKSDDQSITLNTSVGALSLLSYKPGDWVTGASGGATWYGLDGKVLSKRSTRNAAAFTAPVSSALNVTAAVLQPANNTGGEGTGMDGSTGQSIYSLGATYTSGPLKLTGAYLSYTNAGDTDATTSNVTRLGGSYNLGVATVGIGYQNGKNAGGSNNIQTALSASAPLGGAFSVNATYASNQVNSNSDLTAGLAGTRTGYMAGLQYNLSKRTYAILNTASWTGASATTNDEQSSSMTALTLVHDF